MPPVDTTFERIDMNEHVIPIEPCEALSIAPYGELLLPPSGESVYWNM